MAFNLAFGLSKKEFLFRTESFVKINQFIISIKLVKKICKKFDQISEFYLLKRTCLLIKKIYLKFLKMSNYHL